LGEGGDRRGGARVGDGLGGFDKDCGVLGEVEAGLEDYIVEEGGDQSCGWGFLGLLGATWFDGNVFINR
jgi:hypothetical protein